MDKTQIEYIQSLLEDAATTIFQSLYVDWNNSSTMLNFYEWAETELRQVDKLRKAVRSLDHV